MREIFVFVVLSIVAVQIQSKSVYRNGRNLKLNEVPAEQLRQIPVVIIQEEVLVPVQTLQNIEPVAEVEEPGVVFIENNVRRKDDLIVEADVAAEQEEHFPVAANDDAQETNQENLIAVAQINDDLTPVQPILKQDGSSTSRPSIIEQAQQIINNNPFTQFVDSIRRPSTKAPEAAGIEATTSANILQQLQAGVQNIGSQLTSAFTPGQSNLQASASNPAETVVRPPNFLEQLQTNFQNTVQGIFRPNTEQSTSGNQPQGPFQAVLSNVQNFLTGNRGDVNPTQASASDNQLPVDNKVDPIVAEASEPVVVAVEPAHPVETANNAESDAVVLVGSDSSLENESE